LGVWKLEVSDDKREGSENELSDFYFLLQKNEFKN